MGKLELVLNLVVGFGKSKLLLIDEFFLLFLPDKKSITPDVVLPRRDVELDFMFSSWVNSSIP